MDMLKDAFTNAPALATIDYTEGTGEIILTVDTSSEGWGAILQEIEKDSSKRHPVSYESTLWTEAEKKYKARKLECRPLL